MLKGLLVFLAILAACYFLLKHAGNALAKRGHERFAAIERVPGNKFTLRARGWSGHELRSMFAQFAKLYSIDEPKIAELSMGLFSIDWPGGIEPAHMLFAVNYAQYPKDFDTQGRLIAVAAHVAAGQLPGIPADRSATVFVPADNVDFDRVHAIDDQGNAYLGDFGDTRFEPISDARMPAGLEQLFS